MRMYQYDKHLDFHALGREIKRKREAKGWTQEYLAQLVDRTPRSIMYMENRGQKPSLNVFYQLVTDVYKRKDGINIRHIFIISNGSIPVNGFSFRRCTGGKDDITIFILYPKCSVRAL